MNWKSVFQLFFPLSLFILPNAIRIENWYEKRAKKPVVVFVNDKFWQHLVGCVGGEWDRIQMQNERKTHTRKKSTKYQIQSFKK